MDPEENGAFVSANSAREVVPDAEAVTRYDPGIEFAVKTGDTATPEAFVATVVTPPAKEPPGPALGGVNTTLTPGTGFPAASRTVADKGAANAVLTGAVCGVPPVAMTDAGTPTPPSTVTVREVPVMNEGPVAVKTVVPGACAFIMN
jgi:hypothetical protein